MLSPSGTVSYLILKERPHSHGLMSDGRLKPAYEM